MMRRWKGRAFVTVPLCLALTCLAVFLLSLAEAARYDGLKADVGEWTHVALESLFAGYQPTLLETYGMFYLDGGFGAESLELSAAEDEMEALLYENLSAVDRTDGMNAYRMHTAGVTVDAYQLATDGEGKVFAHQAAETMKTTMGRQAAQEIMDRITGIEKKERESGDPEQSMQDAKASLDGLASQAEAAKEENQAPIEAGQEPIENPLDLVKQLRQQGILALVFPSGKTVSQKEAVVDNCLLKRDLETGNFRQASSPDWYERVLMQEFLKTFAGDAVSPNESGALSYGTEYLICGKGSDMENLKGVVHKLLLLRECLNFLYLQTDQAKQAEALSAATAVVGALANPAILPVVQQGILAAWAYVESICDVKALLAGGNVPLLKYSGTWKTEISALAEAVNGDYSNETEGFSYESYLDALLYATTLKKAAYRGMDLMEWSMQKENRYARRRMDHMITGIKITAEYDAVPLFLGFFEENRIGGYQWIEQAEYVYGQ